MKEIKLKGLDLSVYVETLDNGLDVLYVPFVNKKNYFVSYATRYGSETTTFTPVGAKNNIKVPDGIAHFLEHKMFEQEDGTDPFSYFSTSGTGANASTSFDNTQYIFYGTKNFEDNLRFLLRYVNEPYYTDENVEKEKGIIAEEIKMYEDMPDWQCETKLREAIYKVHPRRVDIGGTVPEIMKITKEDLYTCYNNFYSPNNMFLLMVGNFDRFEASKIVHEMLDKITNKEKPEIKKIVEPKEINIKNQTINLPIKVPKIGMGLKVSTEELSDYDDLILDLYLEMLVAICFGPSSEFRERAHNKKIINNFYTDWESISGYKTLLILSSTNDPDDLINEIKQEFKNISINEDAFTRMKKVWIANEVKMADYVDSVEDNIYDDMIRYNKVIPNKVDLIRNLTLKDLNNIISKINFDNLAVIKFIGKEKD